jgi:hypothetical protein
LFRHWKKEGESQRRRRRKRKGKWKWKWKWKWRRKWKRKRKGRIRGEPTNLGRLLVCTHLKPHFAALEF